MEAGIFSIAEFVDAWYDTDRKTMFGGQTMDRQINPVIAEFVGQFREQRDAYEQLCELTQKRLRALLAQKGIMALVTGRVKDPQRLEQKLRKRDEQRKTPYATQADIFGDIPDLVGTRIALYFPGDAARIGELLPPQFTLLKTKDFPEPVDNSDALAETGFTAHKRRIYEGYHGRRFDGYCATHFRVKLADPGVLLSDTVTIEIQVASVLMHAWSEVEHDLAYKEMMGKVTREEYECLDEINGLVMAGEIALNRLSQLSRKRIQSTQTFDTHYTLAAYLTHWLKSVNRAEHPLGDVRKLFNSYREQGLLTHDFLVQQLNRLKNKNWQTNPDPLADQLLVEFGLQNHQGIVTKANFQALLDMGDTEISEAQLGRFLGRWNALDRRIRQALKKQGHANLYRNRLNQLVEEEGLLSKEFGRKYREMRMLRNQIVHDNLSPSLEEYARIMEQIDALTDYLKTHYGIS